MTWRFQRRIRILPGLSLNIGKRGVNSVAVGPRGIHLTVGQNGATVRAGIPGTGLSWWQKLRGLK